MPNKVVVAVKVRPLIAREKNNRIEEQWTVEGNTIYLNKNPTTTYHFDYVFGKQSSNVDIYEAIASRIVQQAVDGYNGTIFAYGQTSSGKTFTMLGNQENPGITILAVRQLFDFLYHCDRRFIIRAGYVELFNEKVYDLLNGCKQVTINQHGDSDVKLTNSETIVVDADAVMNLLSRGNSLRKAAQTKMNEASSRSHAIFRLVIESENSNGNGPVRVSYLNLVDLAGSERATDANNEVRLKEGNDINKSLLYLGIAIRALSEGKKLVDVRSSKLTRILQASLGGNSYTAIVCNITPGALEETASTLGFATQAKTIVNEAKCNEVSSSKDAVISQMKAELIRLRLELKASNEIGKQLRAEIENKEASFLTDKDHITKPTFPYLSPDFVRTPIEFKIQSGCNPPLLPRKKDNVEVLELGTLKAKLNLSAIDCIENLDMSKQEGGNTSGFVSIDSVILDEWETLRQSNEDLLRQLDEQQSTHEAEKTILNDKLNANSEAIEKVKTLESILDEYKKQTAERIAGLVNEIETLKLHSIAKSIMPNEKQVELDELKLERERQREKIDVLQRKLEEKQKQVDASGMDRSEMINSKTEMQAEHRRIQQQLQKTIIQLQSSLNTKEEANSHLNLELEQATKESSEFQRNLKAMQSKLKEKQQQVDNSTSTIGCLQSKILDLKANLKLTQQMGCSEIEKQKRMKPTPNAVFKATILDDMLGTRKSFATQTDPTDQHCSCDSLNVKILELKQIVAIKTAVINTQRMEIENHPLISKNKELQKKLDDLKTEVDLLQKVDGKHPNLYNLDTNLQTYYVKCVPVMFKEANSKIMKLEESQKQLEKETKQIQKKSSWYKELAVSRREDVKKLEAKLEQFQSGAAP